jgi:hypothetical protein
LKYAFINSHRRVWPISVQCRVLEASVAGYHEHFVRAASTAQRRHLSDDALLVHIKAIHAETRGGYGWPRTWKELLARGLRVGNERVRKLMQLHGIRAKGKHPFVVLVDNGCGCWHTDQHEGYRIASATYPIHGGRLRRTRSLAAFGASPGIDALVQVPTCLRG